MLTIRQLATDRLDASWSSPDCNASWNHCLPFSLLFDRSLHI